MSQAAKFRTMLKSGKMIVAPGAIDCITGRLIDQAGFSAVYMTGAGTSATLGYPDYGLITMTEMVGNAARIANSISIPLISDSDTGFGNELNVFRTVQEFERAGVAAHPYRGPGVPQEVRPSRQQGAGEPRGLHRQDPRRGGAPSASPTSPSSPAPIRAPWSASTRRSSRANLALANGADAVFVEAPQTMAEVEQVPKLVKGPCLLNMVRGGKTPEVPLADAERMGYAISILPGLLLGNIIAICDQTLAEVKKLGKFPPPLVKSSPAKTFARFGAADWDARRTAFRDEHQSRRRVEKDKSMTAPRTMFEKIWQRHVVVDRPDGYTLLYVDRHLMHDGSSPRLFAPEGARHGPAPRRSRRRDARSLRQDRQPHQGRARSRPSPAAERHHDQLQRGGRARLFDLGDVRQGIIHVVGPEQGLSQPGITLVCGDSPHLDARRAGRARLRHRLVGSDARHGDAVPVAAQAQVDAHHRRRHA